MKKQYNSPIMNVLTFHVRTSLLTLSNTQAATDAEAFSREVDFDIDGEY